MRPRTNTLIFLSLVVVQSILGTPQSHHGRLSFKLVRRCQRSQATALELENTQTLEQCFELARSVRGLALNYATPLRRHQGNLFEADVRGRVARFNSSRARNRQAFWQQPQEFFNCHVLQCPENSTVFRSLVNDSRFDYFSLYGSASVARNYSCLPEIGLFQLQVTPHTFLNASNFCTNASTFGGTGALAHVASANRTNALAQLLSSYNQDERHSQRPNAGDIHLAYVGLYFNRSSMQRNDFRTMDNESLSWFLYRAWAPGHPKLGAKFKNTSCVAITMRASWITVECERPLPFICELYASNGDEALEGVSMLDDECDAFFLN